jgi:hypothetical protein
LSQFFSCRGTFRHEAAARPAAPRRRRVRPARPAVEAVRTGPSAADRFLLLGASSGKKIPIESIKRVTGQRNNEIELGCEAAAKRDGDPPLDSLGKGAL